MGWCASIENTIIQTNSSWEIFINFYQKIYSKNS